MLKDVPIGAVRDEEHHGHIGFVFLEQIVKLEQNLYFKELDKLLAPMIAQELVRLIPRQKIFDMAFLFQTTDLSNLGPTGVRHFVVQV